MSLQPCIVSSVPELTASVARSAFPKGNPYIRLRDELGPIFRDEDFAALYPRRGQPAFSPWRLALSTVMQFVEGLSDRQAADAVRGRIDWKYALALELTDPGFDRSRLSSGDTIRNSLVPNSWGCLGIAKPSRSPRRPTHRRLAPSAHAALASSSRPGPRSATP